MRERLIAVEPIEADLTPDRIDERLAGGWFPWGQRWMTCRAWPMEDMPRDTIWVRVRLGPRRASDRARRLAREGCTVTWHPEPVIDEEHQRLYDRFREDRHPDWTEEAAGLLLHDDKVSPLVAKTREIAVRDPRGRLLAFRWFLQGRVSIAGITAVYDTERSGLGSVARALADQWAASEGCTWSYPGYVWPGAPDPWYYKIKPGRTEWLDPDHGNWRTWDGDEPDPEALGMAEMQRRLAKLGEVLCYPAWAVPCVDAASRGLASPYFVAGPAEGDDLVIVVWSLYHQRYEELRVVLRRQDEPEEPEEPDVDRDRDVLPVVAAEP